MGDESKETTRINFKCNNEDFKKDVDANNIAPEDIVFDYNKALEVLNNLSLDTFFSQNMIPSVRKYPNIETFKSGFISMNEKIYRTIKENREEQYLRNMEHRNSEHQKFEAKPDQKFEHNYKKNHLAILDGRKVTRRLKLRLQRSAVKYCNSQAIIRIFKGYFILMDYHHSVINTHPKIFDSYLKLIFLIFSSIKKEKMEVMIREMSCSQKMYGFYQDLYNLWEDEGNSVEKSILFTENSK